MDIKAPRRPIPAYRPVPLFRRINSIRYSFASLLALGADMLLFTLLLHQGAEPVPATMAGYSLGLLLHWPLLARLVLARHGVIFLTRRRRQQRLFLLSGLIGLAISCLIVGLGTALGLPPHISRLTAIAAAFPIVCWLRRPVICG